VAWTADAINHWHVCSGCDVKQDEATHEPVAEATATTAQTCTICGYEIAPALGVEEIIEPTESTATNALLNLRLGECNKVSKNCVKIWKNLCFRTLSIKINRAHCGFAMTTFLFFESGISDISNSRPDWWGELRNNRNNL
jgi:hypothetical protein